MFCYLLLVLLIASSIKGQSEDGDQCVDKYTNTLGICRDVQTCQSAREDLHYNGIQPTFCSYTQSIALVCCRDGHSILETPTSINNIEHKAPKTTSMRPSLASSSPGSGTQASSNIGESDHGGLDIRLPSQTAAFQHNTKPNNKRISEIKCEEYSKSVTETIDFISLTPDPEVMTVTTPKCNYDSIQLIVGGQNAELGEFPHMAAIGWPLISGGIKIKCGGSLISERYVLTAGHCLSSPRDTTVSSVEPTLVRLGDQNINPLINDGTTPVDINIKKIIKHPQYKPPKKYNDLGLLELSSEVELTVTVRPACLYPSKGFPDQKKAIATGWGFLEANSYHLSEELQKVSLDILDNNVCQPLLERIRNRHWSGFVDSQMCAGELAGGKDTCQGDSGGPLQFASKENHCVFYVIGITSFGGVCGEEKMPAVYTRIYSYLDWIESIVWPEF